METYLRRARVQYIAENMHILLSGYTNMPGLIVTNLYICTAGMVEIMLQTTTPIYSNARTVCIFHGRISAWNSIYSKVVENGNHQMGKFEW